MCYDWVVKTTLEIPEEMAKRLRRAGDDAQQVADRIVGLIKLALLVEDVRDAATQPPPAAAGVPLSSETGGIESFTQIDPITGLRVIESPPDAPIHRMSAQEVLELTNAVLLEQDLESNGVPVRH